MEELKFGMRVCAECKYDVDMEVPNPCVKGKHVWHHDDDGVWDMCCACGLDVDILYK